MNTNIYRSDFDKKMKEKALSEGFYAKGVNGECYKIGKFEKLVKELSGSDPKKTKIKSEIIGFQFLNESEHNIGKSKYRAGLICGTAIEKVEFIEDKENPKKMTYHAESEMRELRYHIEML